MALGKDPLVITVDGLDIVIEETAVPAERVKVYMQKNCQTKNST